MPQIDLSTMSGPELRQLLDSSRRRGDAPLSYKVLQEMAARREAVTERGRSARQKHAEPRLVAVELGEPMEEADDLPPMPNWRPPPRAPEALAEAVTAAAPEPAPRRSRRKAPAVVSAEAPPLRLGEPDPEPEAVEVEAEAPEAWDLQLRQPEPQRPQPRRRSGLRGVAIFALGGVLGIGVGWWAGGIAREGASPLAPAGSVRAAALTLAPTTPAPTTLAQPAPTEPAPTMATEAPSEAAPPALAPPAESTPQAVPLPNAQDLAGDAEDKAAASAPPSGCAAQPTPADREICGDADLRRLQRELQKAYAQALDAHQDRALLRQRQLAWRDARSDIADPGRLATLYQARIRKLNAAAAEARRER